jgi:hypothetical protein
MEIGNIQFFLSRNENPLVSKNILVENEFGLMCLVRIVR